MKKNSKSASRHLIGICFVPFKNRLMWNYHNVRFLYTDGKHETFVLPSDQELFELLTVEGGLKAERHDASLRPDIPHNVVVTGFIYDPICDDAVSFDFSDAGEYPIRWPVVTRSGCINRF